MKMNVRGNDNFETPQELFEQLDRVFNFTLDAACTSENCKCPKGFYHDKGQDALDMNWGGERVFCNPPFSRKSEFIKKAYMEVLLHNCPVVVMVLPLNCMDSVAFQDLVYKYFDFEILRGRISFIDPTTKKPMKGNNSGTVIVYFKKRIHKPQETTKKGKE